MSGIGAAIIGGSAITGLLSANAQKDAAAQAAAAQTQANQQAIAAQQQNYQQGLSYQTGALGSGTAAAGAQNNSLQALLSPFVGAGAPGITGLQNYATGGQNAFQQQQALSGALGPDAQAAAIKGVQSSPGFQGLLQQGVDTINQNASANGNLRSGNAVAAVGQFSPALLHQAIQDQLTNLGTLSSQGSAAANALAALGAGAAGTQAQGTQQTLASLLGLTGNVAGNVAGLSGANTQAITNLTGQQGQIGANNALAQGAAQSGLYSGIGNSISLAGLLAANGKLPGIGSAATTPGFYPGNITGSIQGGSA